MWQGRFCTIVDHFFEPRWKGIKLEWVSHLTGRASIARMSSRDEEQRANDAMGTKKGVKNGGSGFSRRQERLEKAYENNERRIQYLEKEVRRLCSEINDMNWTQSRTKVKSPTKRSWKNLQSNRRLTQWLTIRACSVRKRGKKHNLRNKDEKERTTDERAHKQTDQRMDKRFNYARQKCSCQLSNIYNHGFVIENKCKLD